MINNTYCCYNEYIDAFEIRNGQPRGVVKTEEVNYGITFQFDINEELIAIIIPEPDILFGLHATLLKNFNCNNCGVENKYLKRG